MNEEALTDAIDYIKSWLKFRYEREEVPGYVVAIAYEGKLLMNAAYGYADLEKKIILTPQHIFRVASHSKTFTATAIMQLQEKGKLRIDDYVIDYVPWLVQHKDERWKNVTIRQLMSHGAGVIRDGLDAEYWQAERPFPSFPELKRGILEADLVYENNTKLKYSNYGYALLGLIIESVTDKKYEEYVTENIIQKIKLEKTGPEYTQAIDDKIAVGYSRRDLNKTRLPINQTSANALAPATGFYSTAEDICNYFTAHFVGSNMLLSDESKKEMQKVQWHAVTPHQSNQMDYGLGLEIEYLNNRTTFGHSGGFPGHITKSIADPKDKLVVSVMTNCLNGPAITICKSIYSIIDYFQNNSLPTKTKSKFDNLQGRYMNLWSITDIVVTGEKIVSTYSDTWYPLYEPEELEYMSNNTFKVSRTGSFESADELVYFNIENDKVVSVNYAGAKMWPQDVWNKMLQRKKTIKVE